MRRGSGRDGDAMAGIGFELRKLVETRSIRGLLGAAFAGIVIVAGPWLVSAASVAAAQRLPFLAGGQEALAFTGAMVWAFALSLCLSTGPLYVYVRLSADLIYERRRSEAGAALLKAAATTAALSFPVGLAAACALVQGGRHASLFRISFAALFTAADVLWLAMMTVTVMRKYGRVLAAYAAGMALMYCLAATLGPRYGAAGGAAALAGGYGLTAALLVASALAALGRSRFPGLGRRIAGYAARYRNLALAGTAYALGTWADKALLWAFRGSAAAGTRLAVNQPYDLAFFYANLSLIPGLVFFTLVTETSFHVDLVRFLVFLARRRKPEVEAARLRLLRNARACLGSQCLFQAGVAGVVFLLAAPLSRALGLPAGTFRLLVAAGFFQLAFLAALNMLFYMELYRDAAVSAIVFLAANAALTFAAAAGMSLPDGLSFLAACAAAAAVAIALAFRGLGRFDRIVYLRASGEEYGR